MTMLDRYKVTLVRIGDRLRSIPNAVNRFPLPGQLQVIVQAKDVAEAQSVAARNNPGYQTIHAEKDDAA